MSLRVLLLEGRNNLTPLVMPFLRKQESAMLIAISTTKNENIISHNEEIFPFVVSLSNHERAVHPSTGLS